jgi:hypothetical protein
VTSVTRPGAHSSCRDTAQADWAEGRPCGVVRAYQVKRLVLAALRSGRRQYCESMRPAYFMKKKVVPGRNTFSFLVPGRPGRVLGRLGPGCCAGLSPSGEGGAVAYQALSFFLKPGQKCQRWTVGLRGFRIKY